MTNELARVTVPYAEVCQVCGELTHTQVQYDSEDWVPMHPGCALDFYHVL